MGVPEALKYARYHRTRRSAFAIFLEVIFPTYHPLSQTNSYPSSDHLGVDFLGLAEEEDNIDVSNRNGISLEDMLHQEARCPPRRYTELEEERDVAHDMDIHAVGT